VRLDGLDPFSRRARQSVPRLGTASPLNPQTFKKSKVRCAEFTFTRAVGERRRWRGQSGFEVLIKARRGSSDNSVVGLKRVQMGQYSAAGQPQPTALETTDVEDDRYWD